MASIFTQAWPTEQIRHVIGHVHLPQFVTILVIMHAKLQKIWFILHTLDYIIMAVTHTKVPLSTVKLFILKDAALGDLQSHNNVIFSQTKPQTWEPRACHTVPINNWQHYIAKASTLTTSLVMSDLNPAILTHISSPTEFSSTSHMRKDYWIRF